MSETDIEWGVRRLGEVEPCADEAAARELADRWSYGHPGIELVNRIIPDGAWGWTPRPGQETPPDGSETYPDRPLDRLL